MMDELIISVSGMRGIVGGSLTTEHVSRYVRAFASTLSPGPLVISRDGQVVWEHRLGTPVKTAPTATGHLLLVHDFAGNLWCFQSTEK